MFSVLSKENINIMMISTYGN
jgi:hypothetical protein